MTRFSHFLSLVLVFAATAGGTYIQPAFAAPTATMQASSAADANKIDINTATPEQLKTLKGIGEAYSKRIITGRPYTAKNQILTRGIVPPATYNAIKDQIIAKAPKK